MAITHRDDAGRVAETAPDENGRRFCSGCEAYKPTSEFYRDRRTKSGLTRRCRTCHSSASYTSRRKSDAPVRREYDRQNALWRKFGMTPADYDAILAA